MKTFSQLKSEGLETLLKPDKIDKYTDISLPEDVVIRTDYGESYSIKSFKSILVSCVKEEIGQAVFPIQGGKGHISIPLSDARRLVINPYDSYECRVFIGKQMRECAFNIRKPKDVSECIGINERGSDIDGDSEMVNMAMILAGLTTGPLGLVALYALYGLANPSSIVSKPAGLLAGLGVGLGAVVTGVGIGIKKIIEKNKQRTAKENEEMEEFFRNDSKKALSLLKVSMDKHGKSKDADKLLMALIDKDGNINKDRINTFLESKEGQNIIKDLKPGITEKGLKEQLDTIRRMPESDDIVEYTKQRHESKTQTSEIEKLEGDANDIKSQIIAQSEGKITEEDFGENIEEKIDTLDIEDLNKESIKSLYNTYESINNDILSKTASRDEADKAADVTIDNYKDKVKKVSNLDNDVDRLLVNIDDKPRKTEKVSGEKKDGDSAEEPQPNPDDKEEETTDGDADKKDDNKDGEENGSEDGFDDKGPGDKGSSDSEPDNDEPKDGDKESDDKKTPQDTNSDPSKKWKRRNKKNGEGLTKRYYNAKGSSISQKEFNDMKKGTNEGRLKTLKELKIYS